MTSYKCSFCKREYRSNGRRKPATFRKDGSIHQTYDSTKFCSKKCYISQLNNKCKITLKNNPNIMKLSHKKAKETLKNNPDIMKKAMHKRDQLYKNHPGIMKKHSLNLKHIYKNHPEIRERIIESFKRTLKNNPDIMKKAMKKRKETYKNNPDILQKAAKKRKWTLRNHPEIVKRILEKAIKTKQVNNTFNTSKPEDKLYQLLLSKYLDVKRQYSDPRYPYMCDFYIPSKDLFIEYQGSWTHGGRPFITNDASCQEQLNTWKQKASISDYYKNAIETWTKRDVMKRQTAEKNQLNYIEIWSS